MLPEGQSGKSEANVVVMVDDDDDDRYLAAEAISGIDDNIDFRTLNNGAELLAYLTHTGGFTDPGTAPRPDLVLLDLNMPMMNGFEVLEAIQEHDELRSIPIVVFSTSQAPADILRAYRSGANSYIAKPQSFDTLRDIMRTLNHYWFATAERANATR